MFIFKKNIFTPVYLPPTKPIKKSLQIKINFSSYFFKEKWQRKILHSTTNFEKLSMPIYVVSIVFFELLAKM